MIEKIIKSIKEKGIFDLDSVPSSEYSSELFTRIVEELPSAIYHVPKKYRTKKLCMIAIIGLGFNSAEDWITDNGENFLYLNKSQYSECVCLAFAQSDYFATRGYIDPDVGLDYESISQQINYIDANDFLKWKSVCTAVIETHAELFSAMPKEFLDENICLKAVTSRGDNIKFIPEDVLTAEICLAASYNYSDSIKVIPEKYVTYEICLNISQHSHFLLSYIPEKYRDKQICLNAVKVDISNAEFIPVSIWCEEIIDEMIKNDRFGHGFESIPESFINIELVEKYVTYSDFVIKYVPNQYKNYEICKIAVQKCGRVLEYVPVELRDENMVILAVTNDAWQASYYIPDKCFTNQVKELLIKGTKNSALPVKRKIEDLVNSH